MRVTKNMMVNNFLRNVGNIESRNYSNQNKVSTGIDIDRPSDDPTKASRILFLRTKIDKVVQYQSNIGHISHWTTQTANIMQNMHETFLRAQTLALHGGDETWNQDQRNELAEDIQHD